ncbi:iron-responsive cellular heme oxygenase [Campylobacter avium LMG 24591]|uniref:Iron-responsive cellular heme oxygenase n=1 Tax=Campylobacter avium LMG 24591 TaxID=522484 RepID=A0A222MV06_9BACT|nr:HugZ family heme oxygenase [Campylobacter avium]ASQ29729.1 iron-responsive cellular heme oxygenase [Campylobacter avium LMG 24591]OYD78827.1 iron-responsive cellular heme oxygenase [Campylobacter avium]
MSFESVISHMNSHHKENLVDLCKKFGGIKEPKNVSLKGVDYEGLDIEYNDKEILRVDFPKKCDESTLKNAIIELCQGAKPKPDLATIKQELLDFKKEFGSVCMATVSKEGEVVCSYAPIIQCEAGDFIYISSVAEHFANIKNNPNNVEVMFLEDESKAASVIVRKRLRYKSELEFVSRDDALFDKVYDEFEKQRGSGGGIKTIRGMLDFHLIKLSYKQGRFVKGFGQAYDIDEKGELSFAGAGGMPHKFPHKK